MIADPQPPGTAYLVGGAVRDALLGRPPGDRDWVVVGSTQAAMEQAGYRAVGRDFPVFLHPHSQEEFALARTERRSGPGHRGFVVAAAPDVTLEDDLRRRDLRINAIAQDADGQLIDPYGGQADIAARVLQHVSASFSEDPLRILRVARFAAQLGDYGFQVHPQTTALLREMVAADMLAELPPERIWNELSRALMTTQPQRFIEVLRDVGALKRLLPELEAQFGVPQTAKWHPEIDAGLHTLLCLRASARADDTLPVRFAVLCHDFGKGVTPAHILPGHQGHERTGLPLVRAVCQRLRVPKACQELAERVCRWHLHGHRAAELRPETRLKVLEGLDAFRRPQRLDEFLAACEADARGRTGHEDDDYPQSELFRATLRAAQQVDAAQIAANCATPSEIPAALRAARVAAIAEHTASAPS